MNVRAGQNRQQPISSIMLTKWHWTPSLAKVREVVEAIGCIWVILTEELDIDVEYLGFKLTESKFCR